jgi:hypothetical protein
VIAVLGAVVSACGDNGSAATVSSSSTMVASTSGSAAVSPSTAGNPSTAGSASTGGVVPSAATQAPGAEAAGDRPQALTFRNDSDRARTFVVFQEAPWGTQALAWKVRTVPAGGSTLVLWTDDWSASWGESPSSSWVDGKLAPGSVYRPRGQFVNVGSSNTGNFTLVDGPDGPELVEERLTGDPVVVFVRTRMQNLALGAEKFDSPIWAQPVVRSNTAYGFVIASAPYGEYWVAAADVQESQVLDDATLRSATRFYFDGYHMQATLRDDGSFDIEPGSS